MALTPSRMIALGTSAPDFSLPDVVSGKTLGLSEVAGKRGTLAMFICNHCPYVKHINSELVRLAEYCQQSDIGVVAISANDVEHYPEDSPEEMARLAGELGYPFPYLYDESQDTARRYDATCTPDFFLFDGERQLVYRGRLDDSTPGNGRAVTGAELRHAINALVSGTPVSAEQLPGMGCNIKWK